MKCILILLISTLSTICCYGETLEDGESVYIYTDGYLDKGMKAVGSRFKETLANKKIKWKVKKGKTSSWVSLTETYEKDLLRADADRYVIAIGLDDLWDEKGEKATELSIEDWTASVKKVVAALKGAGKKIVVCSPHKIFEGTNEAANTRIEAAHSALKELATAEEINFCDLHTPFAKVISESPPAKRGKGITTKDGIKIDNKGIELVTSALARSISLAGSTLTRKLRKGDAVVLMSEFKNGDPMKLLSASLKAEFTPTMGVESPRAVNVVYGVRFMNSKVEADIKAFQSARPTILLIYPDAEAVGEYTEKNGLDNGTYKAKLKDLLTQARQQVEAEVFVCTNLIWTEKNGNTEVDGTNYKLCAEWAKQTREVAKETGVPVVDFYQMCLDYIEEHGIEKTKFAGFVKKNGQDRYYPIHYHFRDPVVKMIADLIHFEYKPVPK